MCDGSTYVVSLCRVDQTMSPFLSAASVALLLIAPFDEALLTPSSCLSNYFYGNYRSGLSAYHSVFLSNPECLASLTSSGLVADVHIADLALGHEKSLVWVEREAVEASLVNAEKEHMDSFFKRFGRVRMPAKEASQQEPLLSSSPLAFDVLYQSPDALLVSLSRDDAYSLDLVLPKFWKSTILPTSPTNYLPVPSEDIEPIRRVLENLRFNPDIAASVNSMSVEQMKKDIRFLTGEDKTSGIVSRHSFTAGARKAAEWIKTRVEESGAECELWSFMDGFCPDVIWWVYDERIIDFTEICHVLVGTSLLFRVILESSLVPITIAVVALAGREHQVEMMMDPERPRYWLLQGLSAGRVSNFMRTWNSSPLAVKSKVV